MSDNPFTPQDPQPDDLASDSFENADVDNNFDETGEFDESVSDHGDFDSALPPPYVPFTSDEIHRLSRDPYANFGGIASGVAHRYGFDVSLVRLAFLFTMVITSGAGFVAYLVAWLVIPRAVVWPPPPKANAVTNLGESLTGRQIAIGIIMFGLALTLFAVGGAASRVLIALGLVGGGIWMFMQTQVEPAGGLATAGVAPSPDTATVQPPTTYEGTMMYEDTTVQEPSTPPSPQWQGSPAPAYVPQAVAPRRRRWWPVVLVIFGVLLIPFLILVTLVLTLVATDGGDVEFSTDAGTSSIIVDSPDDLEPFYNFNVGEVELDLSNLTPTDFDDLDIPYNIDIDMPAGELRVLVPDDVLVWVDAEVDTAGAVEVFGDYKDGIRPSISDSDAEDPELVINIELGVGEILVEQVDQP